MQIFLQEFDLRRTMLLELIQASLTVTHFFLGLRPWVSLNETVQLL